MYSLFELMRMFEIASKLYFRALKVRPKNCSLYGSLSLPVTVIVGIAVETPSFCPSAGPLSKLVF